MTRKRAYSAAICALALALLPVAAAGQSAPTGELEGRLTDWHSAPLEQATVTVRNLTSGETAQTTTGKNGSYHLAGLAPGEYRLEADVPSLGHGGVEGIVVAAGHASRVQAALVLQLPPAPELPRNLGSPLDPVGPAVTTTLESEELGQVPLHDRTWQAGVEGTPSARTEMDDAPAGLDAEAGEVESAEGGRGEVGHGEAATTVDGVPEASGFREVSREDRSPGLGESAVGVVAPRSGLAGAGAGRATGAGVRLETIRGGNGLHGQFFLYDRANLWDARNPLTQRWTETAAASGISIAQFTGTSYTPPNSRQSFGLGLGSQIRRDKLYWFAAVDGMFRNDPGVATMRQPENFYKQPTNDELQVLGARLGFTGPDLFEQEVGSYSAALEQMTGLLGEVPRTVSQVQAFGRLDWQISERDHLSLEGNLARYRSPGGMLRATGETVASHSFGNSQSDGVWGQARWQHFVTANLLEEADVQVNHQRIGETAQTPSAWEARLQMGAGAALPEIIADSKYGFQMGRLARMGGTEYPDETNLVVQDSLSWVRGKHLMKGGASFLHLADRVNGLHNADGTYSYADLLNLVTDATNYIQSGFGDINNPLAQPHNCDGTGRVHRAGTEILGLGTLPCYAWFTQRIGPQSWHLSTNDLAAYLAEQWQPGKQLTVTAGVRAEMEQLPGAIGFVANQDLPRAGKMPGLGVVWGPRVGMAWSPWKRTVVRAGAGMYFGRVDNAVALAALTQTGSLQGDLNFYFKPSDQGSPPFPYIFPQQPQTAVAPGAVEFGPRFRLPEVDQAVVSVEEELPGRWLVAASAMVSLGRRLPISVDTNLAPSSLGVLDTITYAVRDGLGAGPLKGTTVTVPFYVSLPGRAENSRPNGGYQQIDAIESRANSTYEAGMLKLTRMGGHGLTMRAHYLFAHAADWNPNESGNVAVDNVLDPADFRLEYGAGNLDIRHSAAAQVTWETPWKRRDWAGWVANHWYVSGVGQFRSGLPYTMRTSGYTAGFVDANKKVIEAIGPGMNGSGGDNRVYGVGRNTYRHPATWTGDLRLGKRFNFANRRELELLAESFNLFNHQNVTRVETVGYTIDRGATEGELPTLSFLTGLKSNTVEFGKPLTANSTNSYRPREFEIGLRARF